MNLNIVTDLKGHFENENENKDKRWRKVLGGFSFLPNRVQGWSFQALLLTVLQTHHCAFADSRPFACNAFWLWKQFYSLFKTQLEIVSLEKSSSTRRAAAFSTVL